MIAQGVQRIGVLRLEVERLLQRVDGLGDLLLRIENVAEGGQGLRGLQPHLVHLGELELRQAEPPRHRVDVSQHHAGLHDVQEAEVRVDHLLQGEQRLLVTPSCVRVRPM